MGARLESAMPAACPCFHGGGGSAACCAWSLAVAAATRRPTKPIEAASFATEMPALCMMGVSLGFRLSSTGDHAHADALLKLTPGARPRPALHEPSNPRRPTSAPALMIHVPLPL